MPIKEQVVCHHFAEFLQSTTLMQGIFCRLIAALSGKLLTNVTQVFLDIPIKPLDQCRLEFVFF
jgi:hypothetical protein